MRCQSIIFQLYITHQTYFHPSNLKSTLFYQLLTITNLIMINLNCPICPAWPLVMYFNWHIEWYRGPLFPTLYYITIWKFQSHFVLIAIELLFLSHVDSLLARCMICSIYIFTSVKWDCLYKIMTIFLQYSWISNMYIV